MGFWLTNWVARKTPGKPLRKPKTKNLSLYGAIFAFFPIWLFLSLLSMNFAFYHLDASALEIWLFPPAWIGIGAVFILVWVRYVPAIVTWVIAAVAWTVTFWLAFSR